MIYKYFPTPYEGDYTGRKTEVVPVNDNGSSLAEKLLIKSKDTIISECPLCGGMLDYLGMGQFQCRVCGQICMDELGRVRDVMDKHGRCSVEYLSEKSGVSVRRIKVFIADGYLSLA